MNSNLKAQAVAVDLGRKAQETQRQRPSLEDYKRDPIVGPALKVHEENADGTCRATVHGPVANARLWDMQSQWRKHEIERGADAQASLETSRVRYANGRIARLPIERIDAAGRKGRITASLHGKMVLSPRAVAGDWCDACGHLLAWCDCDGAA